MKIGMFPVIYHTVFEMLAYGVGFRVFLKLRKQDPISKEHRNWVIAGAVVGAAVGAKLIVWLNDPGSFAAHWNQFSALMSGKGVTGAIVGGWIGVEITKKCIGLKKSTGDLLVIPLILGMTIGRVGCFLTGYYDQTYGLPTDLPWGFDFGDGILRHPTQIYEIMFLIFLFLFLRQRQKFLYQQGEIFKFFMIGYFFFRFFVEFVKHGPKIYGGLDATQVMAIGVFFVLRQSFQALFRWDRNLEGKI